MQDTSSVYHNNKILSNLALIYIEPSTPLLHLQLNIAKTEAEKTYSLAKQSGIWVCKISMVEYK